MFNEGSLLNPYFLVVMLNGVKHLCLKPFTDAQGDMIRG